MKLHARLIVMFAGVRTKVISRFTPDKNGTYVYCPNHTSYLDIVLTYIAISEYFHFMGKVELESVPLFNIFFKKMNIGVNRESIKGSHKAYMRAITDLEKNISISIFPEATIHACSPQLGPMKNGAFKLAIEKQVPIVPVVYIDNWKILPDVPNRIYGGRPGTARIVVLPPIETKGMTEENLIELKTLYKSAMEKVMDDFEYGR
jgi:1-acyl-sn-glycerol-3-phosphate acyltransferase